MSEDLRETVLIIGGGVAGLSVARLLSKEHRVVPLVLEASSRAGGKVKTAYDANGNVKYESGAWRVLKTHRRSVRLFEEVGVDLRPSHTQQRAQPHRPASSPGLAKWDLNALKRRNPLSADHADLETGEAGSTAGQSDDHGEDTTTDDGWLVSDSGFSKLIEKLADGVRILRETRVVDVRRSKTDYVVQCRCLENGGFVNRTYAATTIFICVPPHCAERWTILLQWARAQLYAVESRALHVVHARTSAPTNFNVASPTCLLGQSVATQHRNTWFQASISGGRLARFWYHMRLARPSQYLGLVLEEVRQTLHVLIDPKTVASQFHEHGHHAWRPTPAFDAGKAVAACVMPNPKHLPNVFWCCEAFSSHQGWIEGALETAELAVGVFTQKTPYIYPRRLPQKGELIIEGRIIDASAWAEVHPGGSELIHQHSGTNATDLFYHMRHGNGAWGIVHALQVAVER